MPTDSPRMIPVLRWAVAVVTEHADARAHDPREARAFEALDLALVMADASDPPEPTEHPSTIGAMLDALRADMERLGVVSLHAHPVGVDIVLRREG